MLWRSSIAHTGTVSRWETFEAIVEDQHIGIGANLHGGQPEHGVIYGSCSRDTSSNEIWSRSSNGHLDDLSDHSCHSVRHEEACPASAMQVRIWSSSPMMALWVSHRVRETSRLSGTRIKRGTAAEMIPSRLLVQLLPITSSLELNV